MHQELRFIISFWRRCITSSNISTINLPFIKRWLDFPVVTIVEYVSENNMNKFTIKIRKKSPKIHLCQAPTLPSKSGPVPPTPCNAQWPARFQPRRTLNGPGAQPARSLPREWPLKSRRRFGENWVELETDDIYDEIPRFFFLSFGEIAVRTSVSSIVWWTWRVWSLEGESTNFRLKPTVCFGWRMKRKIPLKRLIQQWIFQRG